MLDIGHDKHIKFMEYGLKKKQFLAHLSQSDRVSFCDRFSSGVHPSSVRRQ
jgi:hypothetical protein